MNYNTAYNNLLEQLILDLSSIETEKAAREFTVRASHLIRSQATAVREFYIGEFWNLFKDAVVRQDTVELAECQQAPAGARMQGLRRTSRQLNCKCAWRWQPPQAIGMPNMQYGVNVRSGRQSFRPRSRVKSVGVRLDTCNTIASLLGITRT
jgi:hypothetical protein